MAGTAVSEGDKPRKLTKNERRRLKKKAAKAAAAAPPPPPPPPNESEPSAPPEETKSAPDKSDAGTEAVTVEYVSAALEDTPDLAAFQAVFDKFASAEELTSSGGAANKSATGNGDAAFPVGDGKDDAAAQATALLESMVGGDAGEDGEAGQQMSRKARRRAQRLSVAQLKVLVARPDVVEAHDVTAADPRLLVYLKGYRNTVPVPRHWCHKRKYLQGKRGIEKTPFQLPEFIAHTGIEKIRTAIMEQEELMKAKQKARGRVKPKMGRIDIDYQVLHDAFFKYQKKPDLTMHGDIYYEGKEFEAKLREKKPGVLSDRLKEALGIVTDRQPPPWLINMQRYGPPPSYPNLRIPGLNAPIPQGAQFGFEPGNWGKPPVDEFGRPLYGDVFGQAEAADQAEVEVDRSRWGEMLSEDSESEEEEEEEEEEEDEEMAQGEDDVSGLETPSTAAGTASVTTGLETPESSIDLRKRAGTETPDTSGIGTQPKELYQVVGQQQVQVGPGLFGTDKKYVLPGQGSAADGDVQVALNPDQLEDQVQNESFLAAQYTAAEGDGADSSFLEADQRKRKRKGDKDKEAKKKSKLGDFKF